MIRLFLVLWFVPILLLVLLPVGAILVDGYKGDHRPPSDKRRGEICIRSSHRPTGYRLHDYYYYTVAANDTIP